MAEHKEEKDDDDIKADDKIFKSFDSIPHWLRKGIHDTFQALEPHRKFGTGKISKMYYCTVKELQDIQDAYDQSIGEIFQKINSNRSVDVELTQPDVGEIVRSRHDLLWDFKSYTPKYIADNYDRCWKIHYETNRALLNDIIATCGKRFSLNTYNIDDDFEDDADTLFVSLFGMNRFFDEAEGDSTLSRARDLLNNQYFNKTVSTMGRRHLCWLTEQIYFKYRPTITSLPSQQFGINYKWVIRFVKTPHALKQWFDFSSKRFIYIGRTKTSSAWGRILQEINQGYNIRYDINDWPWNKFVSMDLYDIFALLLANIDDYNPHIFNNIQLSIVVDHKLQKGYGVKSKSMLNAKLFEQKKIRNISNIYGLNAFFLNVEFMSYKWKYELYTKVQSLFDEKNSNNNNNDNHNENDSDETLTDSDEDDNDIEADDNDVKKDDNYWEQKFGDKAEALAQYFWDGNRCLMRDKGCGYHSKNKATSISFKMRHMESTAFCRTLNNAVYMDVLFKILDMDANDSKIIKLKDVEKYF
eukprot:415511_1